MSATPRTFHCLAQGGDKEDLHFGFSSYRSEEVAEQDGKALGDWLNKNISGIAYLGMIDQLKKHIWKCMERAAGIKPTDFFIKETGASQN